MKVLAMMPYHKNLLAAMAEAADLRMGSYLLVGDKSKIIEICYQENINRQRFEIKNFLLDVDAIDYAKSQINENKVDYVIFDEIPEMYQLNVLGIRDSLSIGSLDVVDLPFLRNFFVISSLNRNYYVDYEDKKDAILQASKLMKDLDIRKINTALVFPKYGKNEILEANMVKMLLSENKVRDVEIRGCQDLGGLLTKEGNPNIYDSGINLLIMKNYEMAKVFINTLMVSSKARVASLMLVKSKYAIAYSPIITKESLFFSLIILDKIYIKKNLICLGKDYVI
ncbi:MAG: hypothetical protein PHX62_06245 [Bacilli bacterium]|nr:hypothetical protein [Bacilli bacterium]